MNVIADEKIICRIRPHWSYFIPKFLVGIFLVMFFASRLEHWLSVVCLLIWGINMIFLGMSLNLQLTLTTQRIIKRHGWKKDTILLSKLENIDIRRRGFIFDVATLVFTTTDSKKPIIMPGVDKHVHVQELILRSPLVSFMQDSRIG